jgi:hypothetical protein
MHEQEQPSIGLEAAAKAIKNGASLTALPNSFCTAGGTSFTHSLTSTRGKVYRVSRRVAEALLALSTESATNALS